MVEDDVVDRKRGEFGVSKSGRGFLDGPAGEAFGDGVAGGSVEGL